jgi:mono/diheme cytochrome c family protein
VLGAGLIVVTLIPGDAQGEDNPIPPTAQSISIGQQLYVQNCSRCHGINGDGQGPDAASLTIKPADFRLHLPYHRDQFFFNTIRGGLGNIMPGFGAALSDEEIWNLINFLHDEFGADAPVSTPAPSPTVSPSS